MYYQKSNIQEVWAGRTSLVVGHSWDAAAPTGTTDGVSGMNGWNTATDCVKMLGIENPYGNVAKWCDGIYFSGQTVYVHKFPQQYADSQYLAENIGFLRPSSSGYIRYFKSGVASEDAHYNMQSFMFLVDVSGSTENTYVGDYCYYDISAAVLSVGGCWRDPLKAGLWFLDGSFYASRTREDIGARLCYRPI